MGYFDQKPGVRSSRSTYPPARSRRGSSSSNVARCGEPPRGRAPCACGAPRSSLVHAAFVVLCVPGVLACAFACMSQIWRKSIRLFLPQCFSRRCEPSSACCNHHKGWARRAGPTAHRAVLRAHQRRQSVNNVFNTRKTPQHEEGCGSETPLAPGARPRRQPRCAIAKHETLAGRHQPSISSSSPLCASWT